MRLFLCRNTTASVCSVACTTRPPYFVDDSRFSPPQFCYDAAPELPLELLLMIAHIRDDHGKLPYGDFNSLLQVNRALYSCLNSMLWKEAGGHEVGTQRVTYRT
jgi:hypothetical protein